MTEEGLVASALRQQLQLAPRVDLNSLCRDLHLKIVEVPSASFCSRASPEAKWRPGVSTYPH